MYQDFKAKGIDDVYCISVNDAFVMNAWARDLEIKNVKMIPDVVVHLLETWEC